jgi:hypothetical protein
MALSLVELSSSTFTSLDNELAGKVNELGTPNKLTRAM